MWVQGVFIGFEIFKLYLDLLDDKEIKLSW